jgi:hypothetical protein
MSGDLGSLELKPLVFMSHAESDAALVDPLVAYLRLVLRGVEFFSSSPYTSLKPGAEWLLEIRDALARASVVVACFSRQSLGKPWIVFESGGAYVQGAAVISLLVDDLSPSQLAPPMTFFQAIRMDEHGVRELVRRLAERTATAIDSDWLDREVFPTKNLPSADFGIAPGIYVAGSKLPIGVGWQRYAGDPSHFAATHEAVRIGESFTDGFRFPPTDSLSSSCRYWGFRLLRTDEVAFYARVKLVDSTERFLVASTRSWAWGYQTHPADEFVVPIPALPKNIWTTVIIDIRSLESQTGGAIRHVSGLRARGPIELSHVWCVASLDEIPDAWRSGAMMVAYPDPAVGWPA